MTPSADPPLESQPQGISLDELAQAFAKVMGVEPRRAAESASPAQQRDSSPDAMGVEGDSPIFAETKIGTVPASCYLNRCRKMTEECRYKSLTGNAFGCQN